jgi:hypothetical protein
MTVKKLVFNMLLVAAVVFLLDCSIGNILRYFYFKETSGDHFRTTYSMEKTKADILVVGSSRANHHYVPEIFEDSLKMGFYNAGRDANGIFYQTVLLKAALKRYTPKLIIIDYYGDFEKNENRVESHQPVLPYYKSHKEIREDIVQNKFSEKVKMISSIYPYNSIILSIAMGNSENNKYRNSDRKGYIPLFEEWKSDIDSITGDNRVEVDSSKIRAFSELLSITKQSGAKVYVVYSPIFQIAEKRQEVDICEQICMDENVAFLDFSKDSIYLKNKYLFRDMLHLNDKGAQIFSREVVKMIKSDVLSTP